MSFGRKPPYLGLLVVLVILLLVAVVLLAAPSAAAAARLDPVELMSVLDGLTPTLAGALDDDGRVVLGPVPGHLVAVLGRDRGVALDDIGDFAGRVRAAPLPAGLGAMGRGVSRELGWDIRSDQGGRWAGC